jgi:putative endonuclease
MADSAGGRRKRGATSRAHPAGAAAEDKALARLQAAGLVLLERNWRVARGPAARGGEIDLVMRAADGTLVFVEVRQRHNAGHGGAAASIDATKRARLVFAAQRYLARLAVLPPCRFDVVALDGEVLRWIPAAFDAG